MVAEKMIALEERLQEMSQMFNWNQYRLGRISTHKASKAKVLQQRDLYEEGSQDWKDHDNRANVYQHYIDFHTSKLIDVAGWTEAIDAALAALPLGD